MQVSGMETSQSHVLYWALGFQATSWWEMGFDISQLYWALPGIPQLAAEREDIFSHPAGTDKLLRLWTCGSGCSCDSATLSGLAALLLVGNSF